jgi:hypothetical protein
MTTLHHIDHRLSPLEHARLFDSARERALQARREAIDEFWAVLGHAIAAAWHRLRRAAATPRSGRALQA